MSDEILDMIDDCEKKHTKLTSWEKNFIDSIFKKVIDGLSDKQITTLERIWERVTTK